MGYREQLKGKVNIDLDLCDRCALQCPMCWRNTDPSRVKGKDLSMEDFLKVIDFAKENNGFIYFAGAASDPIHHPKLIEFLEITYKNKVGCEIQVASSYKSKDWFIKAFKAHPDASWHFGIDGLPKDSHKYRINQDGEKLFNIMLESVNHLSYPPVWQFIVFNYNETHVEYCKQWAHELGLRFKLVLSGKMTDPIYETDNPSSQSRKLRQNELLGFDAYLPSNPDYIIKRHSE
jgi:MoaA/NifB/PqqE/SkfB family radical SAM enzyme